MRIDEVVSHYENGSKDFYVYAETAFIHEGDADYLMKLIDAAHRAKCDGIKFQILLNVDDVCASDSEIYHDLSSWCFNRATWSDIISHAKCRNLEVIAMPIDLEGMQFCVEHISNIDCIEIHPICFNDLFLLKELGNIKSIPVILGISGSTLDEIDYALDILGSDRSLLLMYGFQSFPTRVENIALASIIKYKKLYNLPVGYADHTKFDDPYQYNLVEYAYVIGARIFEKHITLKKGTRRIDYESAVEYKDISRLRRRLDKLIAVLGDERKFSLHEAEVEYRKRRKQLVYSRNIKAGQEITYSCITFKICRGKSDFEQKEVHEIVGCKAMKDLEKDKVVEFGDIGRGQSL